VTPLVVCILLGVAAGMSLVWVIGNAPLTNFERKLMDYFARALQAARELLHEAAEDPRMEEPAFAADHGRRVRNVAYFLRSCPDKAPAVTLDDRFLRRTTPPHNPEAC
jgi:hypothetical protein